MNMLTGGWMRGLAAAAALLIVMLIAASPALGADAAKKKVLFLTKSSGFEHGAIKRSSPDKLSLAETTLIAIGEKNNFEVVCTKDASLFNNPETLKTYDVFAFYTSGDLTKPGTDKNPAMTAEAKAAFLKAVEAGKGVLVIHAGTDTFRSRKTTRVRPAGNPEGVDPYIVMAGGEFAGHGSQQKATMKVTSPNFPGLEGLKDFEMLEEWYSFNNFAPDLHVILVQDTTTMKNAQGQRERDYNRPPFPATWARMQGKGRVFQTSLGHRDDVWASPITQQIILAGMNWTAGNTQFDPTPNLEQVAPQGQ